MKWFSLLFSLLLCVSCEEESLEVSENDAVVLSPCGLSSQIPVLTIFERFAVNQRYAFISCYHTPLEVELSDTSSCIFPFNRFPDVQQTGFYLLGLDNPSKKRLFNARILSPVWSPDGNWLLWSNNENIFKMPYGLDSLNYDQVTNLTRDSAILESPKWSPDQQQIVFRSRASFGPSRFERSGFYLINQDGSGYEYLEFDAEQVAWKSPEQLLVVSDSEIQTYNLFNQDFEEKIVLPDSITNIRKLKVDPSQKHAYFLGQVSNGDNFSLLRIDLNDFGVELIFDQNPVDFDFINESELAVVHIRDQITQIVRLDIARDFFFTLYSYDLL